MLIRRTVVGLVGVLALLGCGGSNNDTVAADSADDVAQSPIVQALAADFLTKQVSGIATEDEASCVAIAIVSGIGLERLESLGMTADNIGEIGDYEFTSEEIGVVVDALFGCVDVKAALASQIASQVEGDAATCVADNLEEDFVRNLLTLALQDPEANAPDEVMTVIAQIVTKCSVPKS